MNKHVREYFLPYSHYSGTGQFHSVIPLHEASDMGWERISQIAPFTPRGWYELSQLSVRDRIEFTRDYWLSAIPYHPEIETFLTKFFSQLDDVGVFLVQQKPSASCHLPQMVYSLSRDLGFYRGGEPVKEENFATLQEIFSDFIFPRDYCAFLRIHDGFCKATDSTGITSTLEVPQNYEKLQLELRQQAVVETGTGQLVNPQTLIPFYESFGLPYYQCFWAEWYPESEMGNVYCSSDLGTISEVDQPFRPGAEHMAFSTFTDWLIFYLEQIEE